MGEVTDYEGLVTKTAQMFYERVGLEFDDMRQELRIKVLSALRSYDSTRSTMSERSYVYSLIANRVKDLKRDAARRANGRLSVAYIEGFGHVNRNGSGRDWDQGVDNFEYRFMHASHDEVYGLIEDAFTMPATVTAEEREVVLMLVVGYDRTEIAQELGVERWHVTKVLAQLREKLADWRPTPPPLPVAPPASVAA